MIINKMVLSEEEKKERRRISTKKYRDKNKEKIKEYYQNNKEKYKEYSQEIKEYIRERQNEYRQTQKGKRSRKISDWKRRGLVSKDYNLLYNNYLKSTNCEECGVEYGKYKDGTGTWKCMDHNHETGLFRNYLCNTCNIRRR